MSESGAFAAVTAAGTLRYDGEPTPGLPILLPGVPPAKGHLCRDQQGRRFRVISVGHLIGLTYVRLVSDTVNASVNVPTVSLTVISEDADLAS